MAAIVAALPVLVQQVHAAVHRLCIDVAAASPSRVAVRPTSPTAAGAVPPTPVLGAPPHSSAAAAPAGPAAVGDKGRGSAAGGGVSAKGAAAGGATSPGLSIAVAADGGAASAMGGATSEPLPPLPDLPLAVMGAAREIVAASAPPVIDGGGYLLRAQCEKSGISASGTSLACRSSYAVSALLECYHTLTQCLDALHRCVKEMPSCSNLNPFSNPRGLGIYVPVHRIASRRITPSNCSLDAFAPSACAATP